MARPLGTKSGLQLSLLLLYCEKPSQTSLNVGLIRGAARKLGSLAPCVDALLMS
jgi:hypothetical protein